MIIANKRVTLSAQAKMAYLLDKERSVAPRLLRGDRDLVCKIYDNSPHTYDRNKLVETVISFEKGFIPTEEQKKEELDLFEKRWLLEPGRVNYIAVEHNEKDCYHIHIIINKLDLLTGTVFNPFPPGHIKELKDYVSIRNHALGLKQVERTRLSNYQRPSLYQKDTKNIIEKNGFTKQEKKTSIDEVLQKLVRDGKIKNRGELIHHLREQGYQIPRIGSNYISIAMEEGQNIRLKSGIYSEEYSYKELLGVEKRPFDISKKIDEVNAQIAKRSDYNTSRYATKAQKPMFKSLKISQSSQSDFKAHTSEKSINMNEHNDTTEKTSQNSFKQAVFSDNDKNDDSLLSDNSPGTTGKESMGAQTAVNNALAQMNNARTPAQMERAKIALAVAQANLEKILARLEEDKKRFKIK